MSGSTCRELNPGCCSGDSALVHGLSSSLPGGAGELFPKLLLRPFPRERCHVLMTLQRPLDLFPLTEGQIFLLHQSNATNGHY